MQITGKITKAFPVDYTDNYGNGYQNIVITDSNGNNFAGRIASKKGYNGGEDITVTTTQETKEDGSQWTRFKRFNPQQGQQAPQQGQQATKPLPQQRNSREVSIERQAAFKAACEYAGRIGVDGETMIKIAIAGHHFIETGENIYLRTPTSQSQSNIESLKYGNVQQQQTEGDQIPF